MFRTFVTGVATLAIASNCLASHNSEWQSGLSGEAGILFGYTKSDSQFNDKNKATSSLNQSGESKGRPLALPMGSLQYTFDDQKSQLFLGTSRADVTLGHINAELGYRRQMDNYGVMSASFLPTLIANTTWSNPYVTDKNRTETDSKVQALRFQYNNIFHSGFSLDMAFGKHSVDKEESGQGKYTAKQQTLLKRDSKVYYLKGDYQTALSRGLIVRSGLSFIKNKADGAAMTSNTYGLNAGIIRASRAYTTVLNLSYKNERFDEANPVFAKKQKDHHYGVNLSYVYHQPFGLKDWQAVTMAGYQVTQSNIDFYGEKSWRLMTGMSYQF